MARETASFTLRSPVTVNTSEPLSPAPTFALTTAWHIYVTLEPVTFTVGAGGDHPTFAPAGGPTDLVDGSPTVNELDAALAVMFQLPLIRELVEVVEDLAIAPSG